MNHLHVGDQVDVSFAICCDGTLPDGRHCDADLAYDALVHIDGHMDFVTEANLRHVNMVAVDESYRDGTVCIQCGADLEGAVEEAAGVALMLRSEYDDCDRCDDRREDFDD